MALEGAALGAVAAVVGGVLSALLTWAVLRVALSIGAKQIVRDDGPQAHLKKQGTPSLGGVGFLIAFVLTGGLVVFLGRGERTFGLGVLGATVLFGLIGFYDDYCKFARGIREGWKARYRIVAQVIVAVAFVWLVLPRVWLASPLPAQAEAGKWLSFGFLGLLGWKIASVIVLVGSVNAVNFSDGLDGLAGGLTAICALCLGVTLMAVGRTELGVLALCLAGCAAGFLWLNSHPASIFMGDVGSYGLGAALGAIALVGRLEILFALMGFVFVAEALSVIAQVVSFRTTGKRIFRMAPLHHHFELIGWPETKVVVRFWLIGALLGAAGLGLILQAIGEAAR
jgi:phospho-N-acetylmuramoyl-pentapeptide-transferase